MAECEERIKLETGLKIRLYMSSATQQVIKPEELLVVVAHSLGMNPDNYSKKSKKREVVTLRFLASLFIRQYWPKYPLKDIAELFGGQDHTTIINGLNSGANYLDTGDEQFTTKYNIVKEAVENWMTNYEKTDS